MERRAQNRPDSNEDDNGKRCLLKNQGALPDASIWVFELRALETTVLERRPRTGLIVLLPTENVGMQIQDQREFPE